MTSSNNGNTPPPPPASSGSASLAAVKQQQRGGVNTTTTTTTTTSARPSTLLTPGILHMGEEGMYDAPISAYSIGAKTYTMTKLKEEHVHDDNDDIEQPPTKVLAEEEVIGEDDEKEKIDDDDDGGGDDDEEEEEEIKSRPFLNLLCNPKCLSPTLVWILMGVAVLRSSPIPLRRLFWIFNDRIGY